MSSLLNLIRTRRLRRDVTEEIRSHIEERVDSLMDAGTPEIEARRQAMREFGNPILYAEIGREVWGWNSVERLAKDARLGLHQMKRAPGFTAAAVLSMALGIGANTVIFSLVHTVLLRALPYPHPERLVMVNSVPPNHPERAEQSAFPDFIAWRDQNRVFDSIAAVNDVDRDLGADASGTPAARIYGQLTSASFFDIVGVKPILGRVYTPEEDRIDRAAAVVVISHRLWVSRYNGDPKVIGMHLRLDGEPTAIIGVMPPGFNFFNGKADFWRPIIIRTIQLKGAGRYIDTIARLKPGISLRQAQAQLEPVSNQLALSLPAHNKGWSVRVRPLREAELGDFRSPMLMLEAIAGIVLLIACANVAGLLLARSGSRSMEVAIRSALGAGRWRIVRQLLTESIMLSLAGGVCGLLLAWQGLHLVVRISPAWFPLLSDMSINGTVLAFTLALSIATGIAFGAAPAWHSSRLDLATAMKDAGRASAGKLTGNRSRSVLVTAQIALSLILLAGAGLAINSFLRMETADRGFNPDGLIGFQFRLPRDPYTKVIGFGNGFPLQAIRPMTEQMFTRIQERLRHVPGVLSVAGVSTAPLEGAASMDFTIEGRPAPAGDAHSDPPYAASFFVTPGYFEILHMPILNGRDFDARDTPGSAWGVVINEEMARLYWPNENPIGKRLTIDQGKDDLPREIIGVVRNANLSRIEDKPYPAMYVLHTQQPPSIRGPYSPWRRNITFILRISGDLQSANLAIRRAVSEIVPDQAITGMRPLADYGSEMFQWPRYYAILMGVFAGIATVLAAVGIYGLIAYSVTRRTREIGIRVALGATRNAVALLVMREAVLMIVAGTAVGLAGSFALTRVLASVLWHVTPTDPLTFTAVSALLAMVSLIASWLPARRALRVHPGVALRYE